MDGKKKDIERKRVEHFWEKGCNSEKIAEVVRSSFSRGLLNLALHTLRQNVTKELF